MKLADKLDAVRRRCLEARRDHDREPVAAMEADGRQLPRLRAHAARCARAICKLNELVSEVLTLYGIEEGKRRHSGRALPNSPAIRGDATQLRQVIHNPLQKCTGRGG